MRLHTSIIESCKKLWHIVYKEKPQPSHPSKLQQIKVRMNEGEKARKYFVMCIAHYCVFEDRSLLLSEPEVHAKIFGDIHDSTQVIFLVSVLSFGRMYK